MLQKKFRFSGQKSLMNAMRKSKNFNTEHLSVKIHFPPKTQSDKLSQTDRIDLLFANSDADNSSAVRTILTASTFKCAVIVSKKISKRAVKRNKIRRRIYEIIRTSSYASSETRAHIIIRVKNPQIFTVKYSDLQTEILNVLNYIHK